MPTNLNTIAPRKRGAYDWENQQRGAQSKTVTVHFGDVASAAEEFVRASPALVGCIAWVTSPRLIAAMKERPVSLVVNKEFVLRKDSNERRRLMELPGGIKASWLPNPLPDERVLVGARCAGHAARGYNKFMHHKFLVRLNERGKPTAVWTGSFNFTTGAEGNIENGMVIEDTTIAQAFLEEFARVWALSEPLGFTKGEPTPGSQVETQPRKPTVKRARKPSTKRKTATTKRKTATVTRKAKKAPTRRKTQPTPRKKS